MLQSRPRKVDVLQAPHHGSARVDVLSLLRWCEPGLVASCQAAPRNGNPGRSAAKRWLGVDLAKPKIVSPVLEPSILAGVAEVAWPSVRGPPQRCQRGKGVRRCVPVDAAGLHGQRGEPADEVDRTVAGLVLALTAVAVWLVRSPGRPAARRAARWSSARSGSSPTTNPRSASPAAPSASPRPRTWAARPCRGTRQVRLNHRKCPSGELP